MGFNDGSGKSPMNDRLDVKVGSLDEFAQNLDKDVREFKENLARWVDSGNQNSPSHPEISMGGSDDWPGHTVKDRNTKAFSDMARLAYSVQFGLTALKDGAAAMAKAYPGEDDYSKITLDNVDFTFTPPKSAAPPPADPYASRTAWKVIYDANGVPIGFDKNNDGKISEDEKIAEAPKDDHAPAQDPNRYKYDKDGYQHRDGYGDSENASSHVIEENNDEIERQKRIQEYYDQYGPYGDPGIVPAI